MKSDSPHARELLKLSADFSTEILKARKEWGDIFIVLKGKNLLNKDTVFGKTVVQK